MSRYCHAYFTDGDSDTPRGLAPIETTQPENTEAPLNPRSLGPEATIHLMMLLATRTAMA